LDNGSATTPAISLINFAGIPSGPTDFLTFKVDNKAQTVEEVTVEN